MPKFAVFFTLRPETVAAMMERPSDRTAVVRKALEPTGGTLDAYYWMFGAFDGMVIADVPDSSAAAAISLAVSSSGAFGHVESHELIPADEINEVLAAAKRARAAYSPPGA